MKKSVYLLVLLVVFSCNSQKNRNKNASLNTAISQSKCPKDGICVFEILKNKTFSIKSKFGNTYPEFSDGTHTILKFEYIRNPIPNTQDSEYRELIYVEIDSNIDALELEGKNLVKAKVSFGRLCFCRGQTGYYPVTEGQLSIYKNNDKSYSFKLHFKVTEVPQVITSIEESFTL